MIKLEPVTLVGNGVVLEPMNANDVDGLIEAASDGELWTLWYTAIPEPKDMRAYVTAALNELEHGKALPWLVRDLTAPNPPGELDLVGEELVARRRPSIGGA
jgi:N-acetyltransferase